MATETMSKRTKFMPDGQNAKEAAPAGECVTAAADEKTKCVLVTGRLGKVDGPWIFPMGPAAEGRSDTFTSSTSTRSAWASLLSVLMDCLSLEEVKRFLEAYVTLEQCFWSRTVGIKAEGWGNDQGLDWDNRTETPEALKEAELMLQAVHLLRREGTHQQIFMFLAPEAEIMADRILEVANDFCIKEGPGKVRKVIGGETTTHTFPSDIVIVAHVQL